jgi:hypothetical protein
MAQQIGDVAMVQAYSTHELSSDDALEAAVLAEEALDADAPGRCSVALGFGAECVVAASRRHDADHLHVPMRNLEATVDRAQTALAADHERAPARAEQAIAAIRRSVAVVDESATEPALGHRYL